MENNIPGLKAAFRKDLARLRKEKVSIENARRDLAVWSAIYRDRVVDGDTMCPGEGVYGAILEAYAMREALRKYIEENENGNV